MTNHKQVGAAIREAIQLKSEGHFDGVDWQGVGLSYCWEAQAQKLIEAYAALKPAQPTSC